MSQISSTYSNTPEDSFHDVRMRGEELSQAAYLNFMFQETAASLTTDIPNRTIKIIFDVEKHSHDYDYLYEGETPKTGISKKQMQMGQRIMSAVKKEFQGPRRLLKQFVSLQKPPVQFEGPYLPAKNLNLELAIYVSRDASFDGVYNIVKKTLDTHPLNEERISKDKANKREQIAVIAQEPFKWSEAQMRQIENMNPEELLDITDINGLSVFEPEDLINYQTDTDSAADAAVNILRDMARRRFD